MPENTALVAAIMPTDFSIDDVKKGLARLLPALELIAKLTPFSYDDLAVSFIKQLLDGMNK